MKSNDVKMWNDGVNLIVGMVLNHTKIFGQFPSVELVEKMVGIYPPFTSDSKAMAQYCLAIARNSRGA